MFTEVAVENFTAIPAAIAAGANRIELNDNLTVGGTTASRGVMSEASRYASEHHVPITAMIRPRGGDFVYNDTEIKIMEADLFSAQELGIDGIAIGALTPDHKLDTEALEQLLAAAGGMSLTFHMAFDEIAAADQAAAIDWLAEHDFDRILTHGGPLNEPIEAHFDQLKQSIQSAAGRLLILPGGGITADNAAALADALSVKELHGTKLINF
ncbi:copper homeostasis protein CutC [Furfurilactobacillus siliginis]|uniref:copper homeostasis protein CutC n=1 Tax=Furfurilactobacillus siliginis TaxID=348151 RepID=UPI000708B830|nr:copper homeostasis protein CutC [Furfurilactobacillus siliginis]